jgi:hypothetical protein
VSQYLPGIGVPRPERGPGPVQQQDQLIYSASLGDACRGQGSGKARRPDDVPALVHLRQVWLKEPHLVKMLKADVDRSLRDPDPVSAQSAAQLRECKPTPALVIGVYRKDGGGQLDELRILDHSAGIGCERGCERTPRRHLLSHCKRLSMVIQQARLPPGTLAICPWPGCPLSRNVVSPGRSRIFLHHSPFKITTIPIPLPHCGNAIVRSLPAPAWIRSYRPYATA